MRGAWNNPKAQGCTQWLGTGPAKKTNQVAPTVTGSFSKMEGAATETKWEVA